MKFRIAVAGIIFSTGIFVFSSMNIYLEKRIKLVLVGGSFIFGLVSLSTLFDIDNSYQNQLAKISKDSDLRISSLQQENEDLINSLQNKIAEATQEKDSKILQLESTLDKLTQEVKSCDTRVENASLEIASRYEAEISVIKQQLTDRFNSDLESAIAVSDELRRQLDINQQKLEQFYCRENNIITEERRLDDVKKQLNLYKEQLKINQQQSALELEKALLSEKEKFDELVRANELYKNQLVKYQEVLNSLQSENTNLKNSSQLRIAHGASYEAFLSHVIQNTYLENGIRVSLAEFSQYGDSLIFKYYLPEKSKADKSLRINNSLALSTGKHCYTNLKDGYLVVRTSNEKSRDVRPIFVPSNASLDDDYFWLEKYFLKSFHSLVIGATGRGKGVLVDNVAAVASLSFNGQAEIFVIDPKYPFTEWTFGGKKFKPQYRGLSSSKEGQFDSFDGLRAMLESLKSRKDAAEQAADNDREIPDFNPQIWVVDESPWLRENDKDLHSEIVKIIPSVGRAMKIHIIVISQETNLVPNGLTSGSSRNFTRYYLGDSALVQSVLKRETISTVAMNKIKADIEELMLSGQEYFALVCPGQEKAFVEVLPPPGFYAEQQNPPLEDKNETNSGQGREPFRPPETPGGGIDDNRRNIAINICPKCGGLNLLKNGVRDLKSGKVQRYKCGDCGKQFSVKLSDLVKV